jgi:hypothetical protein
MALPSSRKLWYALCEVDNYLRGQSTWFVNYAKRYRAGLRVGTSMTEGTANFLVNRRMNKAQQMRWSRRGADLLLQVRLARRSRQNQTSCEEGPSTYEPRPISLRVKKSRAESKTGPPAETKLAVGSRHGAPSKASRPSRQKERGMNQNASGPSIMAGLSARVGSRTADCDIPYTGLTTNGLARHTWSAFSDDVTAKVSADFVGAHCLTILNEPMNHEGGRTTTDLCLSYRPDQGAWNVRGLREDRRRREIPALRAGYRRAGHCRKRPVCSSAKSAFLARPGSAMMIIT